MIINKIRMGMNNPFIITPGHEGGKIHGWPWIVIKTKFKTKEDLGIWYSQEGKIKKGEINVTFASFWTEYMTK